MSSFRPVRSSALVMTGVAIVALSSALSLGAQPFDPSVEGAERDALVYASDLGVGFEEAVVRFELQNLASDLERELAAKEWASFAGLWIEHEPAFRVVVRFTENGRRTLRPYVAGSDLDGLVVVRGARYTYAQLQTAQEQAVGTLRKLGVTADAGISVQRNRAEIYVLDPAAVAAALEAARLKLPEGVVLVAVPELSVDEAEIYAGLSLGSCTSGWSVKNSAGTKGISTAGHCGNSLSYAGVSLPFKAESYSGSCDVQWHDDATHSAVNKFVSSSSTTIRSITATKSRTSQTVGEYVCKYGITTGYTCGYISDKNFKPSSPSNALSTYIRVHRDGVNLSEGGDSGGPWFNSNTGYGIHKCGIGDDSCYTAINYVASCLSLTVLTS